MAIRTKTGKAGIELVLAAFALLLQPSAYASGTLTFRQETACIISGERSFVLTTEIAETPSQQRHGLMDRDGLPKNAGMLFVYKKQQSARSSFWMHRTRIPLSIAFLDREGYILALRSMEPCSDTETCPVYAAGVPFHAALEVNLGYFTERGIGPGDRVIWNRQSECPEGKEMPERVP